MFKSIISVITLLSILFSLSEKINAQSPDWSWVKGIGGADYDKGASITVDPAGSGDVYTTGSFGGTVDFDPGAGTFNLTSEGKQDIFISKLDGSGNFVWTKSIGGIEYDHGESIALDASANVYITGSFSGPVDFDPGEGVFHLSEYGGFILKLDASGNFVWAKAIGGNANNIALEPMGDGNIYISGHFSGTIDFDPGEATFILTSAGLNDIFILKLNGLGNFLWAKAIGAQYYDYISSITVDARGSGDIYTTGQFRGTVDFNPDSSQIFNLTSAGDYDIYILKLNVSGHFVWAKAMGGIKNDGGISLAVDPDGSGDIYTTGQFRDTVDFDPDSLGIFQLNAAGFTDIFISKLDGSGNFVWAKAMGKTGGSGAGVCIAVDLSGNEGIYTTGEFGGTVDFDPDAGSFYLTAISDGYDAFVSKLDGSGNFVWAKPMGGLCHDNGSSIFVDDLGMVYVTGIFDGPSISFDSTIITNSISTCKIADLFIAKLNALTTSIDNVDFDTPQVTIYPNPAANQLTIEFQEIWMNNVRINMCTILGEVVYSRTYQNISKQSIIDISTFPSGIYFIELTIDGIRTLKKVLKK